jgi:hypothetical protein
MTAEPPKRAQEKRVLACFSGALRRNRSFVLKEDPVFSNSTHTRVWLFLAFAFIPLAAIVLTMAPLIGARAEPAVSIRTDGIRWLTTDPRGVTLANLSTLVPGDSFVGMWTVTNANGFDVRYTLTTEADNADGKNLAAYLQIEIKTPGTGCERFDGERIYRGTLAGARFGDPAFGAQAGDRMLKANSGEALCVRVVLPLSTPNAVQGAKTTAVFAVRAESVD